MCLSGLGFVVLRGTTINKHSYYELLSLLIVYKHIKCLIIVYASLVYIYIFASLAAFLAFTIFLRKIIKSKNDSKFENENAMLLAGFQDVFYTSYD